MRYKNVRAEDQQDGSYDLRTSIGNAWLRGTAFPIIIVVFATAAVMGTWWVLTLYWWVPFIPLAVVFVAAALVIRRGGKATEDG